MTYLTDGVHLYEVASERVVQNFGRVGGVIRTVILRDCVSEATAAVGDLELLALREVSA